MPRPHSPAMLTLHFLMSLRGPRFICLALAPDSVVNLLAPAQKAEVSMGSSRARGREQLLLAVARQQRGLMRRGVPAAVARPAVVGSFCIAPQFFFAQDPLFTVPNNRFQ